MEDEECIALSKYDFDRRNLKFTRFQRYSNFKLLLLLRSDLDIPFFLMDPIDKLSRILPQDSEHIEQLMKNRKLKFM
jgi:hypothetical protein